MLELIGLIAVIYLAVKFLPEIAMFALKVVVVLVGLWLLLCVLTWMFGLPVYYIYF
jgi:hypothetical protein